MTYRSNGTSGPNVATERRNRDLAANVQVRPVGTGRLDERSGCAVATSLSPKPFSLSPPPEALLPSPAAAFFSSLNAFTRGGGASA